MKNNKQVLNEVNVKPQETHVHLPHLVSMENLTPQDVQALIDRAMEFRAGAKSTLPERDFYVANLFFENSTRTHRSFEMAERRLGLQVLDVDTSTSSTSKGETLYDTALTLSALGVDAVVIRHSEDKYYEPLIQSPHVHAAVINGGDGSGQHPSQCLLDLMTIYQEFKHFDGLKVAIVGDLRHSRVARSNMMMLKRLGAEVYFSGPKEWYVPEEFDQYGEHLPIDELVEKVDVMMMLRVQHERHDEHSPFSKENYHQEYGLTEARGARLQDHAIIMHPAPVNRDVEIADSLVEAPKSRIVQQMSNGVYMRMAILEGILS